jgi:hypothetical protein
MSMQTRSSIAKTSSSGMSVKRSETLTAQLLGSNAKQPLQGSPSSPPQVGQIPLQRKLAIGAVDDPLEHEADAVANRVMRMPDPAAISTAAHAGKQLQRKCSCGSSASGECDSCKKEKEGMLQRSASSAPPAEFAPPIVHDVLGTSGQPLDGATRAFFEPRFGRDLGSVRVHADSRASESARAVNARAYTVGSQIVFEGSASNLRTKDGQNLLAHELAHVAQQGLLSAPSNVSTAAVDDSYAGRVQGAKHFVAAGHPVSLSPESGMLRRTVSNKVIEDFQKGAKVCLVHIHGEEHTAFAAAKELRSRRCVNLMHLDTVFRHKGLTDRFINFEFSEGGFVFEGSADPNRIFTATGRAGPEAFKDPTPKPGQVGADKVDSKRVRAAAEAELANFANNELIPSLNKCRAGASALPVLAMHNNDGLSPEDRQIKKFASKDRSPNPAAGGKANPHDFYLVTQASDFDALKDTHNVILQENPIRSKNNDGSLSVFLADQRFINIEKEGRDNEKVKEKTKGSGFQVHDPIFVQDYALAAEALDLLGVPDMPCAASPDFKRRTQSFLNRRLGQSGRVPAKLATDKPVLPPTDFSKLPLKGCLTFKDQPALDRRADEWRTLLNRIPLIEMIHWVLGGPDFTPAVVMKEFGAQRGCLVDAMTLSLSAQGASLPKGKIFESEQRSFKQQEDIWERKFAFKGVPFDRISDFARNKCTPLLGTDVQWNPGNKDHKTCWNKLGPEEKQKEILMASSAPGVSRHHSGVDFDFGKTPTDLDPKEWTGTGHFADAYSWLARNASAFGFIQPFDTKGGYGTGYMTERWHWSYYPVAQATMEFVMDHEPEVEAKLQELWGDGKGGIKPEFTFIAKNWRNYLFNVEQEGIF